MTDTFSEIERRHREAALMALSGGERVQVGAFMTATARALVRVSVLRQRPHASEAEMRQALFLRLYGDDFPPREIERIVAWLARQPGAP